MLVPLTSLVPSEHCLGIQTSCGGSHFFSENSRKCHHSHFLTGQLYLNQSHSSRGFLAQVGESKSNTGEKNFVRSDSQTTSVSLLLLLRLVGLQLEHDLHEVLHVAQLLNGVGRQGADHRLAHVGRAQSHQRHGESLCQRVRTTSPENLFQQCARTPGSQIFR